MNEIVSIIIPVYNSENTLDRCLNSVLNQTYQNIEIILVNDGSIDRSLEICNKYGALDQRVVVIDQTNKGVSAARNKGIEHAKGRYLTFVDSDDYIEKDMVQILYTEISVKHVDLSIATYKETDLPSFCIESYKKDKDNLFMLIQHYLVFGPTQKLYKKEIIDSKGILFPLSMSYGEDVLFNLNYLMHSKKIGYINKKLYNYDRTNENSLSQKKRWGMFEEEMRVNKALLDWFEMNGLLSDAKYKCFIEDRLVDTVCNSCCLPYDKESPWKVRELPAYYKSIVDDELTLLALESADNHKYPKWLIFLIKNKMYLALSMTAIVKRL